MKLIKDFVLAAILASALGGCVTPLTVVQGTVVSYTPETQTVVLKNEDPPNQQLTLSLKDAEIGAEIAPNDVLRVSYREEGGVAVAVRVMNITRQKDLLKGGD